MFDKVEDPEYFCRHRGLLRIEYLYYLNLLSTPMDELLSVVYHKAKFTLAQYKTRVKKKKVLEDVLALFAPEVRPRGLPPCGCHAVGPVGRRPR